MKLITLEEWDAASVLKQDELLQEGAVLSQEDCDRLSLRLRDRLLKEKDAQQRSDRCLVEPVGGKVGDHPRCAQYPDCSCGGPPPDAVTDHL